jgi:ribosomal protein S21
MIINVEVRKNANESGTSLLRRFSRKVLESGVLRSAKSRRFNERPASKLTKKKKALKRLEKRKEIERLRKLGKM